MFFILKYFQRLTLYQEMDVADPLAPQVLFAGHYRLIHWAVFLVTFGDISRMVSPAISNYIIILILHS